MKKRFSERCLLRGFVSLLLLSGFSVSFTYAQSSKSLQVCATVPDLGNLAQEVGGDQVKVTVFAKSQEDPHFIEAKPSFVKALSQADLYIQIGMELEMGYAPVLLQNARNGRVLPVAPGFLDASKAIRPLEVPSGNVDRSMGDVHTLGNPHYLLDPLNGLLVARLIRDRLIDLRPERKTFFEERFAAFFRQMGDGLVGEKLSRKYDLQKLAALFEEKTLAAFLKEQREEGSLGGWLGMTLRFQGSRVVTDHNLWPYFARRFGISVAGFLEPKPGISPTTKHLQALVEMMKAGGIRVIVSSPYYDVRHAQFVSKNTGAKIVYLAHQVGSRPGTDNYLSMTDYNVRQLVAAFSGQR